MKRANGFTLIEVVIILAMLVMGAVGGFGIFRDLRENGPKATENKITSIGYDFKDVDVYLDLVGMTRRDFLNSVGLRKQYEAFRDGKLNLAKHQDTNGSAATGLAVGVAIGSSMNAGRR